MALPLQFKWIAKRELFFHTFFGMGHEKGRVHKPDRKHPREAIKAMDDAAQKIRGGINIIIFPEGTRSEDGSLLLLKRGVFTLALRAKVPILPGGDIRFKPITAKR